MKEVSIIAATFYGNRGAEAMLCTTIAEIKKRYSDDLYFNVFSYYPDRDSKIVNNSCIQIYSSTPAYLVLVLIPCAIIHRFFSLFGLKNITDLLPNSVRALARSKILICLAGVSFIEGRTKFLLFDMAIILPAMLLSVPVIRFSQALGPFRTLLNRFVARIFLSNCTKIFTRGKYTHSHLKSLLELHLNYERADDIAFMFKPEYCFSTPREGLSKDFARLKILCSGGRIIIGVCPSSVVAKRAHSIGWDYAKSIADLISDLVRRDYVIALYPNATRGEDMESDHNNDLPLLNNIQIKLTPEIAKNVVKFSGSLNAAQIHEVINICDIHVVSRFHAMVAALSLGVPVLVIGWSHKYLEVMERFGQEDMVIDYLRGRQESTLEILVNLLNERLIRSNAIINALPEVKRSSQIQLDFAVQCLRENL
jgi:colanic acid/amylovoran biosynthesis protein